MKGIVKIFDSFEYVEKDLFIKAIDELNKNKIENIKVNSLGFTGNFKATNEKNLLLLTIPYDRGIEIKIDGVKTNYEKYLNGAIGVKVDEGSHEIEFIYHVIGLRLGLVISLMSMVIYFIKCYWKRLKK